MTNSCGAPRDPINIVIVVSYFYLATPLFSAIKLLTKKNCNIFLFYPKDINGLLTNNLYLKEMPAIIEKNNIQTISFNWYFEKIMRYSSKFCTLIKYIEILARHKNYKKHILRDLNLLEPDIVLFLTDMNYSSRILIDGISSPKKFILQPSFIDLTDGKLISNRRIKAIINFFIPGLFSIQPYFSLERPNIPLLAWGICASKILRNRRSILQITNPLLQKISFQRGLDINFGSNLKWKNSNLVIFVSDLHIIFGADFLSIYKSNIKEIINLSLNKIKFDKILLKIHPNDNIKNWSDLIQDDNFSVSIVGSTASINLVKKASFIICSDSYVALEAIAYGIPVINFIPNQFINMRNKFLDIDPKWYALDASFVNDVICFFEGLRSPSRYSEMIMSVSSARRQLIGDNLFNNKCISRFFYY